MVFERASQTLAQFLRRRGYVLRELIAATYTVDSQTLLSLAAAVYGAAALPDGEEGSVRLTDVCLDYDRITACAKDRLRLYACFPPDGGGAPQVLYENALGIFETCGRRMTGRTFHPKLLLAVFQERETKTLSFRLEVGSRNLTAGRGVELSVYLEGVPAAEEAPNGGALAEFFRCAGIDLPVDLREALTQTRFQVPEEWGLAVSGVEFAYQDPAAGGTILQTIREDLKTHPPCPTGSEGRRSIQVWSPFLFPGEDGHFYLDELGDVVYHTVLTKSLLAAGQGQGWDNVYAAAAEEPFYHGKLLLWPVEQRKLPDGRWEDTFRVWLGSANASKNGMERNIELMVGLTLCARHKGAGRQNRYQEWLGGEHFLAEHTGGISRRAVTFLPFRSDWGEERCRLDDLSPLLRAYTARIGLEVSQAEVGYVLRLTAPAWEEEPAAGWSVEALWGAETVGAVRRGETARLSLENLPPAGVFRLRIRDGAGLAVWEDFRQARWAGAGKPPFPSPTPMTSLLDELTALDAVPRCAVAGFARGEDDLYQRLRAYLCSHRWDGQRDHPAWRRLRERLEAVRRCVEKGARGGLPVYMAPEERGRLEELFQVVEAGEAEGGEARVLF